MTKLKTVTVRAEADWITALDAIIPDGMSRSQYVIEAANQRAAREGHSLPGAAAPWGVRSDALPAGWKSRLYRDRYQLVAILRDREFEIHHLHEWDGNPDDHQRTGLLMTEEPPCEILVIDANDVPREIIQQSLHLAVLEFLSHVR